MGKKAKPRTGTAPASRDQSRGKEAGREAPCGRTAAKPSGQVPKSGSVGRRTAMLGALRLKPCGKIIAFLGFNVSDVRVLERDAA